MSYWSDIWAVLEADFVALDRTEAAAIGAPRGETVSLYAEMESRHGAFLAHVACAIFSVLIQRNHCANQLAGGVPMKPMNKVRAAILLVFGPPIVALLLVLLLKGVLIAAYGLLRGWM